eukprot:3557187-Ditylum_brightwellii.AAC.1
MEVQSVLKTDNVQIKVGKAWSEYCMEKGIVLPHHPWQNSTEPREYEGVRNRDMNVQKMASTKKSTWKLIMDVTFGHAKTRSIFRKWEMQGNVFHKICHVCKTKTCVEGGDTLEGKRGKQRNR